MKLFNRHKKHDPFVRLIDLATDKLEPNSHYLLVFNRTQINIRDCQQLANDLRAKHIKSSVVIVDGDVRTAVRAYSIPIELTEDISTLEQMPVQESDEVITEIEHATIETSIEYEEQPIKQTKATITVQE